MVLSSEPDVSWPVLRRLAEVILFVVQRLGMAACLVRLISILFTRQRVVGCMGSRLWAGLRLVVSVAVPTDGNSLVNCLLGEAWVLRKM